MRHPVFHVKFDKPPIEAYSTIGNHDLNKFKSRLPDNTLNEVKAFQVSFFLEEDFLRCFSMYSYVKKKKDSDKE